MTALIPAALRQTMRDVLPLSWRLAFRRAPSLVRDLCFAKEVARTEETQGWQCVAKRTSPLRRAATSYSEVIQAAKVANVTLAAQRLDGVLLGPGDVLSWHRVVGPPLAVRGFQRGPELHDGNMSLGVGGGVCQVANMVFWLGLHGGLDIVERHRHSYDLFPDQNRDVPFGCGATVFYPHRDLKMQNQSRQPVVFRFSVKDGNLEGVLLSPEVGHRTYKIVERRHRFVREQGVVWRNNSIYRQVFENGHKLQDVLVVENRARVCYPVTEEVLER